MSRRSVRQNRRAGGSPPAFTPLTLSPLAWYQDDSIQQAAGTVTSWQDKSGNANHLATSVAFPTYSASGGPNSKPAIVTNGTTQYLLGTVARSAANTLTVFTVGKYTQSGYLRNFSFCKTTIPNDYDNASTFFISNVNGGAGCTVYRNSISVPALFGAQPDATFFITAARWDGVNLASWLNGTSQGNVRADAQTFDFNQLIIGAGWNTSAVAVQSAVTVSSVIVYASSLASANVDAVNNYLKARYAL